MAEPETYHAAFEDPPGTILAGIPISNLKLVNPNVSYGLPYDKACSKHIRNTFNASRVYIVASKSLAANTDKLDKLEATIGKDVVVGIKKGITPHTPWSEILQIAKECREANVDCLVTLGAGSVTDGCKVCFHMSRSGVHSR
jgi:alcohol dehydrogenase class IV